MADFVALLPNQEFISIYEYKERLLTEPNFKKNNPLRCLCGKKLFFKDESIEFLRKTMYGNQNIQRVCHFSHRKNEACYIQNIQRELHRETIQLDDKPDDTTFGKKIERLNRLFRMYGKSEINARIARNILRLAIRNAEEHNINYMEYILPDDRERIGYLISEDYIFNHRAISIRNLEEIEIDFNTRYTINEIQIERKRSNDGRRYTYDYKDKILISNSYKRRICNDDELYKKMVKNLSLVILNYSRCIKKANIIDVANDFNLNIDMAVDNN